MGIEFQILGPLAASEDGRPLTLGGRKQRALLTVLLLHANELVPADRLVDEIWHDAKPEAAARSLQVYVSSLRKELGKSAAALQTLGGGYVIEIASEQLDAARFERGVDEGTAALSDGDPERAATILHEALALWRGPALADLGYESFALAEVARLEELRLVALETRIDAELALGRNGQVVAELEALVDEHPLRERLRRQLMLALYRTGRQPEALQTYRDARDALVEELGLEPSAELRELQSAMLRQDPALAVEPPELRARRHLPTPATPLVGRRAELEYVHELFRSEDARLATLTGPGGTGKTRLAVQAAWELAERFPDGVYFVDLAPVRESSLVPNAIAGALDVRERPSRPLLDTLKEHVLDRQLLLVLDNFEHVHEAAPIVSELLAEASGVRALVTSRMRLRLYGEHEYPVPPLTEEEALDLFAARARAVRPGFALDGARTHVAELCRCLDGLPLAIELAAARSGEFSPEQMLGFLTRPLELATDGPVDVPARQQTLRATIEWSHGLLDEAARSLFARLGVFVGGCTLEAAEEVCGAELETLASLVDKSLVGDRVGPGGDPRFVMLETIREHALERLEESGEELRGRHLVWSLAFAERAEPELRGPEQKEWLDRLHAELDNFRAAFDWSLSRREKEASLRLASALLEFWIVRADWSEGRAWVERALALPGDVDPALHMQALRAAAELADVLSDYSTATRRFEESLAIARAVADQREIAESLMGLAHEAERVGRGAAARPLLEESVAIFRELGDEPSLARSLGGIADLEQDYRRARSIWNETLAIRRRLGNRESVGWAVMQVGFCAQCEGDYIAASAAYEEGLSIGHELGYKRLTARCLTQLGEAALLQCELGEARRRYEQSLPLWRETGHRSGLLDSLRGLGNVARLEGQGEDAASLLQESLAVCRDIGSRRGEASALQGLGDLAGARGELEEAARLHREALALWRDMEDAGGVATALWRLGGLAALEGGFEAAARLLGASDAFTKRVGATVPPCDAREHERAVAEAQVGLDGTAFEAAWTAGRGLELSDAADLGLAAETLHLADR
jgi:predicted ATPase/DNA-binding SARP family transcriptional activator